MGPTENDVVVDLQTKNWEETQAWEKAELEDGWFKLRSSYAGDFILDLSEDGQKLKLSYVLPCQGRKPCLRWVHNNFLVDILIFNSIFQCPILWL